MVDICVIFLGLEDSPDVAYTGSNCRLYPLKYGEGSANLLLVKDCVDEDEVDAESFVVFSGGFGKSGLCYPLSECWSGRLRRGYLLLDIGVDADLADFGTTTPLTLSKGWVESIKVNEKSNSSPSLADLRNSQAQHFEHLGLEKDKQNVSIENSAAQNNNTPLSSLMSESLILIASPKTDTEEKEFDISSYCEVLLVELGTTWSSIKNLRNRSACSSTSGSETIVCLEDVEFSAAATSVGGDLN